MSAFGLEYATYVAAVVGSLVFLDPPPEPADRSPAQPKGGWAQAYGRNSDRKRGVGQHGVVSLVHAGDHEIARRLKPVFSFGFSVDGAAYASLGVRKDFRVGAFRVTPSFGPALFQSELGTRFQGRELVQFRTGVDVTLPVGNDGSFGLGFFHLSNAKLNGATAGIDVTHVVIQFRF